MERGEAEPARWHHMSLSKVMRDPACLLYRPKGSSGAPFFPKVGRIRNQHFYRIDAYGYGILDSAQLHKGLDKCLLPANTGSIPTTMQGTLR